MQDRILVHALLVSSHSIPPVHIYLYSSVGLLCYANGLKCSHNKSSQRRWPRLYRILYWWLQRPGQSFYIVLRILQINNDNIVSLSLYRNTPTRACRRRNLGHSLQYSIIILFSFNKVISQIQFLAILTMYSATASCTGTTFFSFPPPSTTMCIYKST